MSKFLDSIGVSTLWNKVKGELASKLSIKVYSNLLAEELNTTEVPVTGSALPLPGNSGTIALPYNAAGIQKWLTPLCIYNSEGGDTPGPYFVGILNDITSVDLWLQWQERPSAGGIITQTKELITRGGLDSVLDGVNASIAKVDSKVTALTNSSLKVWSGTLAQYNAIASKDSNTLYIIT